MKVSIITVCLNDADVLESTVQSVLAQDHKGIEYIIIDGNSSDKTIDIVDRYKDQIAKTISEKDNGIYDAMNKGIAIASGDVVAFLNAGDIYANHSTISTVVSALRENSADCCYGDLLIVSRHDTQKVIRKWTSGPWEPGLFDKGWHPPHPTFFVKKTIIEKYGNFNYKFKIAADYEMMLRLLRKHNIKTSYIREVLVKMIIGGESNKNVKNIIRANIECYRAWRENALKVSPLVMLRKPLSKLFQCFHCS